MKITDESRNRAFTFQKTPDQYTESGFSEHVGILQKRSSAAYKVTDEKRLGDSLIVPKGYGRVLALSD